MLPGRGEAFVKLSFLASISGLGVQDDEFDRTVSLHVGHADGWLRRPADLDQSAVDALDEVDEAGVAERRNALPAEIQEFLESGGSLVRRQSRISQQNQWCSIYAEP